MLADFWGCSVDFLDQQMALLSTSTKKCKPTSTKKCKLPFVEQVVAVLLELIIIIIISVDLAFRLVS